MAHTDSTFAGAINTVFSKAAPNLTDDELQQLEKCGEVGKNAIYNLTAHIEGLACLVASDGDDEREGPAAGSFQTPDKLFSLLLSISGSLEAAHAHIALADAAQIERERRRYEQEALPA